VVLVGPGLGRLSPKFRETVYPQAEDIEKSFPTDVQGGLIQFSPRTRDKIGKGTLTKELVKFKIPAGKIMPNRRYELRIRVEDMQDTAASEGFVFPLKDLPELIHK